VSAETWQRFGRFVLAGGFNAATCIAFSSMATLITHTPTVAFAIGYALSLTLSYFVNARYVFRTADLSVRQFGQFCLSYVPNFTIQFVVVNVLTRTVGLAPAAAFTFAVAIAVPVTFFLLSAFTFVRHQPYLGERVGADHIG
jgi:putative flippase GtrA